MKTRALLLGAILAIASCGKKEKDKSDPATGGGSGTATATASGDAAGGGSGSATGSGSGSGSAEPDDDPMAQAKADEDARRKGKKTGLGAADEKPEVVVEDLIRGIASGKIAADRFLDPKKPVIERIKLPGGSDKPVPEIKGTHCGAKAKTKVADYIKRMVEAEAKGKADDVHQLWCNNAFADKDDPEFGADDMGDKPLAGVPMKHVSCVASGGGEYDEYFGVELLPDPALGFRIAAIVSVEGGDTSVGVLWHEVATELAAGKPCK
jgi:hypothetical protein